MSEHKKKFYQVPFNDALVGFLYILAYAMYFEFLPILYRKIVDPLAPFDVRWLFCSFVLGAFGLVFIVMTLWKIADKLPFGFLSVLCRCLGVIVGIPSVILIAIPMIHLLVPYYITRFFLKITGHTAAKKAGAEKGKKPRISLNWPQAVIRFGYVDAEIAGSSAAEEVQMEEANEGEMHSD